MTQAGQPPTAAFKESQIEVDGFNLWYWESAPPHPLGAIVLLEGMTWGRPALREALGQSYQVIALELPGFGDSPANDRSQSVSELAGATAQATAAIAPSTYTLIGMSVGANVALWQTLQSPAPVEVLVLISPTTIQPAAAPVVSSPDDMAKRLLAHPETAQDLLSLDPAILAKEQALVQRLTGGRHDAEAESRLGEIACAMLIIFGSEDHMVTSEAAGIYRERIANSNLSFVYDAGHLIEAERPEALINAVSDFVERRETFIVGRQSGIINP